MKWTLAVVVFLASACAPELTAPTEATRLHGRVVAPEADELPEAVIPATEEAAAAAPPIPIRVAVHEKCSPNLVFFRECPGKRIGEARLAEAGDFVVEFDTDETELLVYAWRDAFVTEPECGMTEANRGASHRVEVELSGSDCPPEPIVYP